MSKLEGPLSSFHPEKRLPTRKAETSALLKTFILYFQPKLPTSFYITFITLTFSNLYMYILVTS